MHVCALAPLRALVSPLGALGAPLLRTYYTVKRKEARDELYVSRQIYQRIQVKGPLTVADYMREVLTSPVAGYYMRNDMFGERGDFITSPETTQMFGEMIAIWLINEWQKMGSPKPLQIIELGPGRGSLSQDILKVFNHFNALHNTSLKLVEVSPTLSEIQAKRLCKQSNVCRHKTGRDSLYRQGVTHEGIPVEWYTHLQDIPNDFSLIIAHEFFDALPIHKFQKTYMGYREVLIDIAAEAPEGDENFTPTFRYVLSRFETPMSKVLVKPKETREHLEVSADGLLVCKEIARRIKVAGGIGLICDYGENGSGGDTFRAYRKHKQVDPLVLPGTADLTADVDFKLMNETVQEAGGVICYGPVTQRDFLVKIGLEYRLKALVEQHKEDHQLVTNLQHCYDFLTNKNKMGQRFKFFGMFPETTKKILDKLHPAGFV